MAAQRWASRRRSTVRRGLRSSRVRAGRAARGCGPRRWSARARAAWSMRYSSRWVSGCISVSFRRLVAADRHCCPLVLAPTAVVALLRAPHPTARTGRRRQRRRPQPPPRDARLIVDQSGRDDGSGTERGHIPAPIATITAVMAGMAFLLSFRRTRCPPRRAGPTTLAHPTPVAEVTTLGQRVRDRPGADGTPQAMRFTDPPSARWRSTFAVGLETPADWGVDAGPSAVQRLPSTR